MSYNSLIFDHMKEIQKPLVLKWLKQPHIEQWLHGDGLKAVLEDLDKFSLGTAFFTHWIGCQNDVPFAYLLTSKVKKADLKLSEQVYLCDGDRSAITLDVFIGEPDFIGKGLAVPMIQTFLIRYFSDIYDVFIDPEANNTRAIHVYKKVGFKIIGEFIASWHPVPHYKMHLCMKSLRHNI